LTNVSSLALSFGRWQGLSKWVSPFLPIPGRSDRFHRFISGHFAEAFFTLPDSPGFGPKRRNGLVPQIFAIFHCSVTDRGQHLRSELLATLRGLAPLDLRPPSSSRGQALGEIADGRRSIMGLYQACKSRRLCVRVGSPIAIRSDRSGPRTHIFLVPESATSSSDSFQVTCSSC